MTGVREGNLGLNMAVTSASTKDTIAADLACSDGVAPNFDSRG
jgi:hypothetical protein